MISQRDAVHQRLKNISVSRSRSVSACNTDTTELPTKKEKKIEIQLWFMFCPPTSVPAAVDVKLKPKLLQPANYPGSRVFKYFDAYLVVTGRHHNRRQR